MSDDYTFMKTGQQDSKTVPDLDYVMTLLTIFTEDALKLCDVYVTHENRTIVTKIDTIKALQVRAYYGTEFWSRPDIQEKIEETKMFLKDLNRSIEQEEINRIHEIQEHEQDLEEEDHDENKNTESESETSETETETSSLEEIVETEFGLCSCDICHKMNNIHLHWSSWNPRDHSDKILKDAINRASASAETS